MTSINEDPPKPEFICKPSQDSLLRRTNLNGLSALPDELLLEIIAYFPLPDSPTLAHASTTQIMRREMLASLLEVCQNLRRVFRPFLWQRVEVYDGMRAGTRTLEKRTRQFAVELLRQLNVVTVQDPSLAQHVRTVDVEINATFRALFTKLGRCFSLLPNLHTVKIITPYNPYETILSAIKRGFKRSVRYPQIRSAVLSCTVHPLIAVCPNLESLTTSDDASLLPKYIKGITTLQNLHCPLHLRTAAVVAEEQPALQQIRIQVHYSPYFLIGLIKTIQPFKNLKTLVLHRGAAHMDQTLEELKQAFRNLPPCDRQNLKEVIFSGFSVNHEEVFTLPPF